MKQTTRALRSRELLEVLYFYNSTLRFTYFYICNILFRANFIQVSLLLLSKHCVYFLLLLLLIVGMMSLIDLPL